MFGSVDKWVSDEAKHNPGKSIEVAKYVYAAIFNMVEERRQRGVNPQHFQEKDLLEVLLDFEGNGKDEPSKISELYLETFLLELFIAAPDATNITTEWAMSELLRKPETMNKLQAEIAQVVGHEKDGGN
ncbi:hypothetical protein C5167_019598 [Papaver somniferum]|uniref:Cytochrome P450 n=1 Tax=Papaver somniferum TaxID=3469 RepID=A0A4Y7IQL3_PAPSO|nr:hypothetical protein C5167_019598 [Papaver somniferum]